MATLTIRNVPPEIVDALKSLARRNRRSMEEEVRALLRGAVGERQSVLDQVEASWKHQRRPTTAREIDSWIKEGRS
jgi:plasmid stability protein